VRRAYGKARPNAPGTIDADYPDEWFVLVQNASDRDQTVRHGERIAQAVLQRYETPEWVEGEVGRSTDREGGFGSTG
jgi:dUTP pyrophosphatase